MGQLADLYGVEGVCEAVEEAVLEQLAVEGCADALMRAQACGLMRVEAGCKALALGRFEAVAATEGFARVDEATLGALLADDALVATREERVFEALARWMRHDPLRAPAPHAQQANASTGGRPLAGAVRGEGLLRTIRFALMQREYLEALGPPDGAAADGYAGAGSHQSGAEALLRDLWAEARAAQATGRCLVGAGPEGRAGKARYWSGGGEEAGRVAAGTEAFAVAVCGGRVWCGGWDGGIRVWGRAGLGAEVTATGHTRVVCALAVWGGYVMSGSSDSRIGVWDATTGRSAGFLPGGHAGGVNALAVS